MIYAKYRFFAAAFAIAMIGLLWVFIERTPYGAIIKAGAHDSEIVRALGINLSRLRLFVFALGAALAAIAGIVMAPFWGIRPHVGVDAVVPAFLIIVLGGVGSFWGAVLASLLVGLTVGLTGAYASEWSLLSMYLLLVAVDVRGARTLRQEKRPGSMITTPQRLASCCCSSHWQRCLLDWSSASINTGHRNSGVGPVRTFLQSTSRLYRAAFLRSRRVFRRRRVRFRLDPEARRHESVVDLAGAMASPLAGALVAAFISHRRGIYYALMTIAFCRFSGLSQSNGTA
jgi:ABC-type branched-subunit amino acid transport system permease subunit